MYTSKQIRQFNVTLKLQETTQTLVFVIDSTTLHMLQVQKPLIGIEANPYFIQVTFESAVPDQFYPHYTPG